MYGFLKYLIIIKKLVKKIIMIVFIFLVITNYSSKKSMANLKLNGVQNLVCALNSSDKKLDLGLDFDWTLACLNLGLDWLDLGPYVNLGWGLCFDLRLGL